MNRTKLTKTTIAAFRYEGDGVSRDVRWDSAKPGFGVRVYPSGRKAFVLSYRARKRKKLMVIGDVGTLTVDQARDRASRHLIHVEDGRDPLEEKRAAARGKTLGDLLDAYVQHQRQMGHRTWKATEKRLSRNVPSAMRSRDAGAILTADIADLHAKIGAEHPYEANRGLEHIRTAYNRAALLGISNVKENPAKSIRHFPERKRKRWVRPEEVVEIARAIDTEPNIYVRAGIWLYLLLGVRKTELLEARRDHIDWNRAQLRLPDTKSGEEQTVALSGPAIAILQSLPVVADNPYILPGRNPKHHLVNVFKPWARIRKAAGVEDVRLHDLRRTVGSWMTQAKVDLNTIRDAMRHANISTTLTYARLGADPARQAMEEHGRRLLAVIGKPSAEVVRIERKT